jgi:Protein kinase domain
MEPAVALTENHLVLGRYRPLRPLGSGGGGSVWLARDEHAGREVALKIVEREGKPGARAEREVDAATRLRHPRCLRALALSRDDRHVYVAYPYVPGQTMREALRGGRLDDWSAVETAAQVLEALAHAHSKGVVHRDVKPANVMLEDSEEVSVRLLDFGLAQLEHADTLTAVGDVPGTLAYIAPERLAGEEATGAADVWAVGVLLWEALAGRHPFWAVSPLETARRVEQGTQPLAELRPDLPRELCRAVDRMLSLDPRKRPTAKQAQNLLRTVEERRTERRRAATSRAVLLERAPHAALAALFAGATAFVLPFFPSGWPFLLGALVALAALVSPRTGLALGLAVPVLPLGNASLGLAVAYVPLALAWFVLFAGDTRSSFLFLAGPPLAFLNLLPVAAVTALPARGAVRRAALGLASVATAIAAATVVGIRVPLTGGAAPEPHGLAGAERPQSALDAAVAALSSTPTLVAALAIVAVAAATADLARSRGLWGIAGWGAGYVTALLLVPVAAGGAPVAAAWAVPAVWLAAGALVYPLLRTPR